MQLAFVAMAFKQYVSKIQLYRVHDLVPRFRRKAALQREWFNKLGEKK